MSDNKRDYDNLFFHAKNNAVYEKAMTYIEMTMQNKNMHDYDKFQEIKEIVTEAMKYIETKTSKEKKWENNLSVHPDHTQLDYTFKRE